MILDARHQSPVTRQGWATNSWHLFLATKLPATLPRKTFVLKKFLPDDGAIGTSVEKDDANADGQKRELRLKRKRDRQIEVNLYLAGKGQSYLHVSIRHLQTGPRKVEHLPRSKLLTRAVLKRLIVSSSKRRIWCQMPRREQIQKLNFQIQT